MEYFFQFITRVLYNFLCINKQKLWRSNLRLSAQHKYHSKSFTRVSDSPPQLLGENILAFIKCGGIQSTKTENNKKKRLMNTCCLINPLHYEKKKSSKKRKPVRLCRAGRAVATVYQMFQSNMCNAFPLHVTAVMRGQKPCPGFNKRVDACAVPVKCL